MNLGPFNLEKLEPLSPLLAKPMWQKWVALAAVLVGLVALYVWFFYVPLREEIDKQLQLVEEQKQKLEKNQRMAENLPLKRAEYAKLQKQLRVALNMLPKQSQIPDLLENISWAGKDAGLEFTTFRPMTEMPKQFYAEVPVDLVVNGSFVQLLSFLKRVGEMPRIVDVRDLSIGDFRANKLNITGRAVTYRFIEHAPGAQQ